MFLYLVVEPVFQQRKGERAIDSFLKDSVVNDDMDQAIMM